MDFDTLWPVITFFLGVAVTFSIELIRDVLTRRRTRAENAAARRQQLADRRSTFEVDNLHAVHAALTRLARAVTRYHLLDRDVAIALNVPYASRRLGGVPGESEIGEELMLAHRETGAVARLVLDDDLRAEVEDVTAALAGVGGGGVSSVENAEALWGDATARTARVQQRIADRIRTIYVESS